MDESNIKSAHLIVELDNGHFYQTVVDQKILEKTLKKIVKKYNYLPLFEEPLDGFQSEIVNKNQEE